jgi:hypothetical protein
MGKKHRALRRQRCGPADQTRQSNPCERDEPRVCEAMTFAKRNGLDLPKTIEAVAGGAAGSWHSPTSARAWPWVTTSRGSWSIFSRRICVWSFNPPKPETSRCPLRPRAPAVQRRQAAGHARTDAIPLHCVGKVSRAALTGDVSSTLCCRTRWRRSLRKRTLVPVSSIGTRTVR